MRTESALGKPDSLHEIFQSGKLKRSESEAFADHLGHALMLRRVGIGISGETLGIVSRFISLQLGDDATGKELHLGFRLGEIDELASVEQRWRSDTHVHLFSAGLEEAGGVVAELGATYDGIVAEKHALVAEHGRVMDELHLSYELAKLLTRGGKGARPRRGILGDSAAIGNAMTFGIADSHTDTAVGNTAGAVDLRLIALTHGYAAGIAHQLGVAAFVVGSGEAVVHPEERAYLHLGAGLAELLHAISRDAYDLARTYEIRGLIAEILESGRLGSDSVCIQSFAHYDRGTAPCVASGNDAVFRKQENTAGAFYEAIHVLDTFHKRLALYNQQTYQFGRVDAAGAELREVHTFLKAMLYEFVEIVDFAYCADGKASEMGIEKKRLCIRIGDNADTCIAGKAGELVFELGAERRVLDAVNHALESILFAECSHTGTTRTEMGVVVGAVEDISYARGFTD